MSFRPYGPSNLDTIRYGARFEEGCCAIVHSRSPRVYALQLPRFSQHSFHTTRAPTSCSPGPIIDRWIGQMSLTRFRQKLRYRCLAYIEPSDDLYNRSMPRFRLFDNTLCASRTYTHTQLLPSRSMRHHSNPICQYLSCALTRSHYPSTPHDFSSRGW